MRGPMPRGPIQAGTLETVRANIRRTDFQPMSEPHRRKKNNSKVAIIVIIALVLLALVWSRTARVSRVGFPQRIAAPH
jgi:hypothetical protein